MTDKQPIREHLASRPSKSILTTREGRERARQLVVQKQQEADSYPASRRRWDD